MFADIFGSYFGMTAVWYIKYIVETTENRILRIEKTMFENAKHFSIERIFFDTVMIIQTSLSSPANKKCRGHMCARPVENGRNFAPVIYFLERHLLHRCTGNDHSVVITFFDFVESFVKRRKMLDRCIFRAMRFHMQKVNFNLQWRVRKQANQIGFGRNLYRHQVQNHNFQWSDFLTRSPLRIHYKYIFCSECFHCGQSHRNI